MGDTHWIGRDTGKLFWRARPVEFFTDGKYSAERACNTWNMKLAGVEAFTSLDA